VGRGGVNLVSPTRYRHLHAALERGLRIAQAERARWGRVVSLRAGGVDGQAERLARKLLGVQGPPMTQETRAKLREYAKAHREDIAARNRQKRLLKRRMRVYAARAGAGKRR
jgi:hypothetical protein